MRKVWSAPDLLGGRTLMACDWSDGLAVRRIEKSIADALIAANHYSGAVVWNSNRHFGVYHGDRLLGALQFGPSMNPAAAHKVVADSTSASHVELNRMWLTDDKPANVATRAISAALRFIRAESPAVEWVQTFADERCKKLGAVYQAASFIYCGSHLGEFYELDGEWFHRSLVGRAEFDKRGWWRGPKAERLAKGFERAVKHTFTQYRYVFFLNKAARRRLLLEPMAYPKPDVMREAA